MHDCGSRDLFWPTLPNEIPNDGTAVSLSSCLDVSAQSPPSNSPPSTVVTTSNAPASSSSPTVSVPRAIWWGLEWIRFVLKELWDLNAQDDEWLLRGHNGMMFLLAFHTSSEK